MSAPTISVIIPVRNMAGHIRACVESLTPELTPGDEIVVVDDGSTDGSGAAAERAGARVMRNDSGLGPYHARNQAAAESSAEALLFIDARSRARGGLMAAHRHLLSESGVALSCTGVEIEKSGTLPGRIAVAQDSFRIDTKITGRGLDFYPTANLGVSKSVFDKVSGFRGIRSGADADLCWRVQFRGLGRIAADERILMTWVPRERVGDLVEQNYRYGKSSVLLERLHADAFARAAPIPARQYAARPPNPGASDAIAMLGARVNNVPFRLGRLRGLWEYRSIEPDRS